MTRPLYILSAALSEKVKIEHLFESKQGSVMELVGNPGGLRYGGWGLQTLDSPRIVKGEYVEVNNSDRKVLRLYEDGTFIFQCSADGEFLGWPRQEKEFLENPRLNPMALVEVTYCFVDFYFRVIKHFNNKPAFISFRSELKNTFLENSKIYMIPYGLKTYAWMFDDERYPAPETNMRKNIKVSVDDFVESHSHIAYLLVREVYLWFGIPEESIPYVTNDNESRKIIDTDKIINSKM